MNYETLFTLNKDEILAKELKNIGLSISVIKKIIFKKKKIKNNRALIATYLKPYLFAFIRIMITKICSEHLF